MSRADVPHTLIVMFPVAQSRFHDDTKDNALAFIKQTCPTFYAGPFLPGLYFECDHCRCGQR